MTCSWNNWKQTGFYSLTEIVLKPVTVTLSLALWIHQSKDHYLCILIAVQESFLKELNCFWDDKNNIEKTTLLLLKWMFLQSITELRINFVSTDSVGNSEQNKKDAVVSKAFFHQFILLLACPRVVLTEVYHSFLRTEGMREVPIYSLVFSSGSWSDYVLPNQSLCLCGSHQVASLQSQ